jgi:hypothetical protein
LFPGCLTRYLILLLSFVFGGPLIAQYSAHPDFGLRRFEIGGQISDIRLFPCDESKFCPTPQLALGPTFSWNISPHFAVGSTASFFTSVDKSQGVSIPGDVVGGRPAEILFDARASLRARRYAFFLNASPGMLSWSKAPTGFKITPISDGYGVTAEYGRSTFFATELGGGMDLSLTSRLHARANLGDLLIRYVAPPSYLPNPAWLNKLQITGSLYAEVGRPLDWQPAVDNSKAAHPFFDRTNILANVVSLLGQSADAITTQRFIAHQGFEDDPLARPFVKYGWPGQIGVAVIVNSAILGGQYGLHLMGHHRIERAIPLAVGCISGILAYNNLQGH